MQKLDLDFRRSPPPSPWGWSLLAASVAFMAALAGIHLQMLDESAQHRARLQTIEASVPGAGARQAPNTKVDAALTAARKALAQSKLPWDDLFGALESADNEDVAVLAVVPEAGRGRVKIHAEARHLAAMLAYHRRLQERDVLHQVALLDHEAVKDPNAPAVRFHIIATWGGEHGRP